MIHANLYHKLQITEGGFRKAKSVIFTIAQTITSASYLYDFGSSVARGVTEAGGVPSGVWATNPNRPHAGGERCGVCTSGGLALCDGGVPMRSKVARAMIYVIIHVLTDVSLVKPL